MPSFAPGTCPGSGVERYDSERTREVVEVSEKAEIEAYEVAEVFCGIAS
jgi:hypothetical protein